MPLLLALLAALFIAAPGHAENADLSALFAAAGVERTLVIADLYGDSVHVQTPRGPRNGSRRPRPSRS